MHINLIDSVFAPPTRPFAVPPFPAAGRDPFPILAAGGGVRAAAELAVDHPTKCPVHVAPFAIELDGEFVALGIGAPGLVAAVLGLDVGEGVGQAPEAGGVVVGDLHAL